MQWPSAELGHQVVAVGYRRESAGWLVLHWGLVAFLSVFPCQRSQTALQLAYCYCFLVTAILEREAVVEAGCLIWEQCLRLLVPATHSVAGPEGPEAAAVQNGHWRCRKAAQGPPLP